ncbi:hypothetical protein K9L27_01835 [Candidatus Gracilibacteria bacterium]|nr:hypothetical protein [Candidatus Gracilibacteria bacterium]
MEYLMSNKQQVTGINSTIIVGETLRVCGGQADLECGFNFDSLTPSSGDETVEDPEIIVRENIFLDGGGKEYFS